MGLEQLQVGLTQGLAKAWGLQPGSIRAMPSVVAGKGLSPCTGDAIELCWSSFQSG